MSRFREERNYSFSEEELKEAAVRVMYALADSLPQRPEPEHEFSPRFNARMKALIRRDRIAHSVRTFTRSVAAVVLMALMVASVWLAFDAEARADFVQWIRNEYEARIVYNFFEKREEKVLPEVEVDWLPEGYIESTVETDNEGGYSIYTDSEGEIIVLSYNFIYLGSSYSVTFDDSVIHEEILINDISADFYADLDEGDSNMLWWANDEMGIEFNLNAPLDKDVMVKIAENIRIIE